MNSTCLSIAGFDGSGGAGLQADLKTFSALGCYGMSVLTALPVQNTSGVRSCYSIPLQAISEQLEAIFDDIVPSSIKIGMLFQREIIETIADFLEQRAQNIPIVLDPVMVAKSGDALLQPDAVAALSSRLLPLATVVTPNLPEAYALVGLTADMALLGKKVLHLGAQAVFLKGGHLLGQQANDLYLDRSGSEVWVTRPRIQSKNTHGTGCTLSAAIAANLALGMDALFACQSAKEYLHQALVSSKDWSLGKGHGPVHHFYRFW